MVSFYSCAGDKVCQSLLFKWSFLFKRKSNKSNLIFIINSESVCVPKAADHLRKVIKQWVSDMTRHIYSNGPRIMMLLIIKKLNTGGSKEEENPKRICLGCHGWDFKPEKRGFVSAQRWIPLHLQGSCNEKLFFFLRQVQISSASSEGRGVRGGASFLAFWVLSQFSSYRQLSSNVVGENGFNLPKCSPQTGGQSRSISSTQQLSFQRGRSN